MTDITSNNRTEVAYKEKIFYANESKDTYVTDSLLKVSTASFAISGITAFQVNQKKIDIQVPITLIVCGVLGKAFSRYLDLGSLSWVLIILGVAAIAYLYFTRQAVLYVHLSSGWCTAIEGDLSLIRDTSDALNEAISYQTHSAIYGQEQALREIASNGGNDRLTS